MDEPVTLEATVLDDGLPDPPGKLSLTWLKVKGPGKVDFDNAHADVTRARFSQPGQYKLRFKANDGHLVGRDQVTVEVRPSRDSRPGKPKPPTKQQGDKKPGKADRQP